MKMAVAVAVICLRLPLRLFPLRFPLVDVWGVWVLWYYRYTLPRLLLYCHFCFFVPLSMEYTFVLWSLDTPTISVIVIFDNIL